VLRTWSYTGVEKREEHAGRHVIWQIASRRSTYKKHGKRSALYKAMRKIEKAKAQVRSKVEHLFRHPRRRNMYLQLHEQDVITKALKTGSIWMNSE
jgi:IS5 family transposase